MLAKTDFKSNPIYQKIKMTTLEARCLKKESPIIFRLLGMKDNIVMGEVKFVIFIKFSGCLLRRRLPDMLQAMEHMGYILLTQAMVKIHF